MAHPAAPSDLDLILAEAAIQARRLARLLRLAQDHVDDLEQDLRLELILRLPGYNPARSGLGTFLDLILGHRSGRLLVRQRRHQRRHQRRWGSTVGLDEAVAPFITLADVLDEQSCRDRLGWSAISRLETAELSHDLARVLTGLSPRLRELCRQLTVNSVAETARRTGRSRATLHRDLQRLRRAFAAAGLDDYLGRRCDTSRSR